jgi:hypothetical protein
MAVPIRSVLAILIAIGCSGREEHVPQDSAPLDTSTAMSGRLAFSQPRVGIAVRDSAAAWCGAFPSDSARAITRGDSVAIVFATADGPPAWYGRVGATRSAPCDAAFPQPRWDGYTAYDITAVVGEGEVSTVALAVLGSARWSRTTEGVVVADLDADGSPEEARRCTADEGEHFTIWSVVAGTRTRRAHEYFDWGAETDPTCKPGENGQDG